VSSQLAARLPPGTYYVVVDSYTATGGAFVLNWSHSGAACATTTLLPSGVDVSGNTCGGTQAITGSCQGGGPETVYGIFACPGTRPIAVTTCNAGTSADTVLYLRRSRCSNPDLACNDDTSCAANSRASSISGSLDAGIYYLVVDTYSSSASCGPYVARATF
jgi:hypothetical protein